MSQKLKLERLKKTDLFVHVIHQMVLYVKFQDKPYDKGILWIKFNKEVGLEDPLDSPLVYELHGPSI